MAAEANLTLYVFDGWICEYASCFGRVRLALSERTSADSCELPYPVENTHQSQTLSAAFKRCIVNVGERIKPIRCSRNAPPMIPNPWLCKALIDRITGRANIIETGTASYRFRRALAKRKAATRS